VFGDRLESVLVKAYYRTARADLRDLLRAAVTSTTWARKPAPSPPPEDQTVYVGRLRPAMEISLDQDGRFRLGDQRSRAMSERDLYRRMERDRRKYEVFTLGWDPRAPLALRDRVLARAKALGYEVSDRKVRIPVVVRLLAGNRVVIDGVVVRDVDVARRLRELNDDDHRLDAGNAGGTAGTYVRLLATAYRVGWFNR
jgi:hypothetical protein